MGTRSARRHMKKLSGKESRLVRNTNHIISEEIVHGAKDTSSASAVENLEGIRMGTTVMKGKMYIHNSWSFHQFRIVHNLKPTVYHIALFISYQLPTAEGRWLATGWIE